MESRIDAVSRLSSENKLDQIKIIELDILKNIIACCEDLEIDYFLAYGTALGTVRHGGFIPWDDDIDIGMTRENYEKLIRLGPKWFCEKDLFLQHITTEKCCPYPYVKIRKNHTIFMEYCNRNVDMHHGIYIDVFPFDEIPVDERAQKKQFHKVQRMAKLFCYRQVPDISVTPDSLKKKIKQCIRKSLHYILQAIPAKTLYKQITDEMTKYNGTGTGLYGCNFYPKFKAGIMTKEMVENLELRKFENLWAKVPGNVEEYLTSQYGDYMQLPPVEERIGHTPYKVVCALQDE